MNDSTNDVPSGPAFKARPIKHWRKQLAPRTGSGRSSTGIGMPMDRPGGSTYLGDTPEKCKCETVSETVNLKENITRTHKIVKPTASDIVYDKNGNGKTTCVACNPETNVIKPASTILNKKYYTDSRAYLRSRNMTYEQKLSGTRANGIEYFGPDGNLLWPTNTVNGPQVRAPSDCPARCETASGARYGSRAIYKPNNRQFGVQGAVSSSSRLERLKLNTITNNGDSFRNAFGSEGANAGKYHGTSTSPYFLKSKMEKCVHHHRNGNHTKCFETPTGSIGQYSTQEDDSIDHDDIDLDETFGSYLPPTHHHHHHHHHHHDDDVDLGDAFMDYPAAPFGSYTVNSGDTCVSITTALCGANCDAPCTEICNASRVCTAVGMPPHQHPEVGTSITYDCGKHAAHCPPLSGSYTVKSGDTCFSIAKAMCGDGNNFSEEICNPHTVCRNLRPNDTIKYDCGMAGCSSVLGTHLEDTHLENIVGAAPEPDCSGISGEDGFLFGTVDASFCCASDSYAPGSASAASGCTNRKKACAIKNGMNNCNIALCNLVKPGVGLDIANLAVTYQEKYIYLFSVDSKTGFINIGNNTFKRIVGHGLPQLEIEEFLESGMDYSYYKEKIYGYGIAGGSGGSGDVNNIIMSYDISSGFIAYLTNMNVNRSFGGGGIHNNKIYAIGGLGDGDRSLGSADIYNISNNTWDICHNFLETPRSLFGVAVLNDVIYSIGGSDASNNGLKSVEAKNLNTSEAPLPPISDMNEARADVAVCVLNGKIYAVGGTTKLPGTGLRTAEVYDPIVNKWTYIASMTNIMMLASVVGIGSKLYVMGGVVQPAGDPVPPEIYDTYLDMWFPSY